MYCTSYNHSYSSSINSGALSSIPSSGGHPVRITSSSHNSCPGIILAVVWPVNSSRAPARPGVPHAPPGVPTTLLACPSLSWRASSPPGVPLPLLASLNPSWRAPAPPGVPHPLLACPCPSCVPQPLLACPSPSWCAPTPSGMPQPLLVCLSPS